jgi:hypothetical protein
MYEQEMDALGLLAERRVFFDYWLAVTVRTSIPVK